MDKQKTYFVHGTGPFPLDMLRKDESWPDGSDDAKIIEASQLPVDSEDGLGHSRWKVRLRTSNLYAPHAQRWASFGVSVIG